MYIATIPNRGSPPAVLLRESYRVDGTVKSRTLSNLSSLPSHVIPVLREALRGTTMVPADDAFEIVEDGSLAHGNAEAVLTAMRRLGFASLINARSSRERDIVVAMVAARILRPQSKLATTRWWPTTTMAQSLGVCDADEDELYSAMDWLLERQSHIEKKLADRHLKAGSLALYDLTSSYFEGVTCPLAARGHNRDGKKGKLQVNFGLLTSSRGVPVAVSVFEGNTGDPKTVMPQIEKMRDEFGIEDFVLVGDRGMITQARVNVLRNIEGCEWISALRPGAIGKLVQSGAVQMELFDERNLFELEHPDFPGERLIACRNPELARLRAAKRADLLSATARELDKVIQMVGRGRIHGREAIQTRVEKILKQFKIGRRFVVEVRDDGFDYSVDRDALAAEATASNGNKLLAEKKLARLQHHLDAIDGKLARVRQMIEHGRLSGKGEIGVRVGRVVNKYNVAKHFSVKIEDASLSYQIKQDKVDAEAALDGLYVVRTSVKAEVMEADQAVRNYKLLSNVERAFRCMKSVDLMVRPIRHRLENRVRAHILLCMLAYYVQWHMIEAWRPLLFADEEQEAKNDRDPVKPAKRSKSAKAKIGKKLLEDGSPAHSFRTLLDDLGRIVQNTCRCPVLGPDAPTFLKTTMPNPTQQRALNLLATISRNDT